MTRLVEHFNWRANSDMAGDVEVDVFQDEDDIAAFNWDLGVFWNVDLARAARDAKEQDVNSVDLLPQWMSALVQNQDKAVAESFVVDVINRIPRSEQRVVDHMEAMLSHVMRAVADVAKTPFMVYDAGSGTWRKEGEWLNERQIGTSVGSMIDRIVTSYTMAMARAVDMAYEMIDEVRPAPGPKPTGANAAQLMGAWQAATDARKHLTDKAKEAKEMVRQIQRGKNRAIKSSLQERLAVSQTYWNGPESLRWLVLQDGVLDLHDVYNNGRMDVLPFSPWHASTMSLNVTWADAEAIRGKTEWERGVEKLLPDADVRRYLQKRYGGALLGRPGTVDKSMVWQYGVGDTGKSTIQEAIAGARGVFDDYSYQADAEVLTQKGSDRGATDRFAAYVRGKRFAIISELDAGAQLNQGKFKQMTGGETVQGTAKYSNEVSYFFTATLFVSSNHVPNLPYGDTALAGRIHTVPFETQLVVRSKVSQEEWDATPPERRADPGWLSRLLSDKKERAGVLRWVLEGLVALGREGLGDLPEAMKVARKEFVDEGDPVARIVNSMLGKDDDSDYEQSVRILTDVEWGARKESDGIRDARMEELIKDRARALGYADDFGEVSKKQVMAAKKMIKELGGRRKKVYYETLPDGRKRTGQAFARCLEVEPTAQAGQPAGAAAAAFAGYRF